MKIEASHLFFDLDGTLADSKADVFVSIEEAYRTLGFSYCREKLSIGPLLPEIIETVSPQLTQQERILVMKTFRSVYASCGYKNTVLYPFMEDVLNVALREGKKLYIATNKPRAATYKVLEKLGIKDMFSYVATPDSENPDQIYTKGEVLRLVVDKFGLPPQDCLMIGDTLPDIKAGKFAGMRTLAFLGGYGNVEELKREADAAVDSFQELL